MKQFFHHYKSRTASAQAYSFDDWHTNQYGSRSEVSINSLWKSKTPFVDFSQLSTSSKVAVFHCLLKVYEGSNDNKHKEQERGLNTHNMITFSRKWCIVY
mmetsp:Transcript_37307/g.57269  ORF Transcript_37307/g.57269 Transcript_37307/m.57269 type:complete len:100 (+) Transcript_37307:422-721(+)